MKFKSQVYTEASGSIGGITYSHNRGGLYTRARSIPTNPNTPQQQAIRAFVSQLTSNWLSVLTDTQRRHWGDYAWNVPIPDVLGEPRNVGGIGMYVRSNVPRLQAGFLRVDDAPTIFNLGEFTSPSIVSITAATSVLSLAFDDGDQWANLNFGGMLILASRGVNPSINYFKGPYRYAGKIEGDSVTPPTSPAAIDLPFVVTADQKCFVQVRVTRHDGRLALPFRDGQVVV